MESNSLTFQVHKPAGKPSGSLRVFMSNFDLDDYFDALENEGLASDLPRLSALSDEEVDDLLERLELRPAQVRKFHKMLEALKRIGNTAIMATQPPPQLDLSQKAEKLTQDSVGVLASQQVTPQSEGGSHSYQVGYVPVVPTPNAGLGSASEVEIALTAKMQLELEEARRKIQELEEKLSLRSANSSESIDSEFGVSPYSQDDIRSSGSAFEENKEKFNIDEAGLSYDSWKVRSAIGHLDIEEMCRCLAKAIRSHIKHSLSHRLEVPDFVTEYGSQPVHYLPSLPEKVQISFNEQFNDEPAKAGVLPDANSIYNLCKNIIVRGRMEKEVSILALVYLERLVLKTGVRVNEFNWKRLLFTVLVVSSKTWDDESFENSHFAEVFSMYTIRQINSMECIFLTLVDYALTVKSSDYAKYYFVLRTYSDRKSRSFPLKAMDVDTLRQLLKAGRAEAALKEIYREPLHKTL